MTFRSLALSNIRGNWRSYSAFFLSSVFSVMIFYIYTAFIYHPDVVNGHIMQAQKVRKGMEFCLYIIGIFSFLFVLYSNSAFLKTRKQEFGLFSLFGMTRSQLRRLTIYESTAVAVLSVGIGIGVGMLFSKLFFMALGLMLRVEEPIPFAAPLQAIALTAIGFVVLFLTIAIITSLRIGKSEIIDLLKAARKPKGELVFSKWLVGLAVVFLGGGYAMALVMDAGNFLVLALPILVTVVIGTYFLFTQLSVLFIRFLQRRLSVYYNRTNMIIVSQLGYKLRDNARILFMVSIMGAVILTASGTFYLMQVGYKAMISSYEPYSISITEKGLNTHEVMDLDKMKDVLKENGHPVVKEDKLVAVKFNKLVLANDEGLDKNISSFAEGIVISGESYNRRAEQLGKAKQNVKAGEVLLQTNWNDKVGSVKGTVNGEPTTLKVSSTLKEAVVNTSGSQFMIVMDDTAFNKLIASVPEQEQLAIYAFEVKDWEHSADAVSKVQQLVPEQFGDSVKMNRAEAYQSYMETVNLTLFIGLFISLLFFIASGSLIYFKLFTELQEDRQQINALKRIGMTREEIRRISVSQIALIFYLPCLVGTVHALIAMKALDTLMDSSVWVYSFVVIGIYVAMQSLYFLYSSVSYLKSVNRSGAAS
ncbi:FtsX-like permease family protein [Paenibacillus sp. NEAU-GSW1]|uniref:FtsX-like permease family protein n=1 Tax=Paenibacillus sp. NEAU-GSW1 TaxID=2682486 RepID=UPI0012E2090B|nr:ABC transporter permease [Paenibacillus sp. NEAU-GSW1]MUT68550.1 FtsX-like permease family protein [Paenibacillus sp. NEAU-GSW1]